MQTWQGSLHIELNKLPRLLYEGDSDVQDTTNIVWVLFSVNWEMKTECLLAMDQQVIVII